ncbi:AbrB/MazE/SpoVT family DNA-binding domain-containing protein [Scytonema sp. PCC 10023]|uniref:AbrB/MazE/SpoVT family DNA-binding domain-containing protein n=1 Tax=Scytonema sp. PCC 10023 TaxID=1680591 RepID=UPI0039C5C761
MSKSLKNLICKQLRQKSRSGGRVVIPSEYRKQLGLEVGSEVMIGLVNGELRIFTLEQAIKRAQEIVRRYVPQGRSLSDELIAERRQESLRE